MMTKLTSVALAVASIVAADETILDVRVKVANLREASKLFSRIFKSWQTERYVPELAPWALHATGGARDQRLTCSTIEKIGSAFLKDEDTFISHDALSAFRDLMNLTSCEVPGLQWTEDLLERVLRSVKHGHSIGSSLRAFDNADLDVEKWEAFTAQWEEQLLQDSSIRIEKFDDMFGVLNAQCYLHSLSGGTPKSILKKILDIIRDPLFNLSLVNDEELIFRLRAIESLARLYGDMVQDFGLAKLSQYSEFEFVRSAMKSLAEELVDLLSREKPGVLGGLKASYLFTSLWRLERAGMLYVSSRESDGSWDIAVSRPLQRWNLGIYLKLQPSDEASWRLTSDESLSYTLHRAPEATSAELPVLDVFGPDDSVLARYQPGSKPAAVLPAEIPAKFWQINKDGTKEELKSGMAVVGTETTRSILAMASDFDGKQAWNVELCNLGGSENCKKLPLFKTVFGFNLVELPLESLPYEQFRLQSSKANQNEVSSITVTLRGQAKQLEEKPKKTSVYNEGSRWWIDTDLDYTFPREIPSPNYLGTAIFSVAVWVAPVVVLARLIPLLPAEAVALMSPGSVLKTLRASRISSQVLYLFTAAYFITLVVSLGYYWACWKLIPYSKFLVPTLLVGSVSALLTLADLESQHRGGTLKLQGGDGDASSSRADATTRDGKAHDGKGE
eukprot:Gregarina_sp_Pseudo_9__1343@NODE_189_length_3701_cov_142_372747_g174_i0_p1_GENE_NODE_189_length_3701_cov_142_372747_g174_i0NODE_189_length_3701_cov_142_372747_g174_i0_p1_ORF_typecomplete_len674_score117_31Ribophorin_II/PF05817_14/0_0023PTPS_related/PF10131_9/0_0081CHAD/PF05235_14/0_27_NODE_189_length_3701_cov_142_372747_g174_i01682189